MVKNLRLGTGVSNILFSDCGSFERFLASWKDEATKIHLFIRQINADQTFKLQEQK